MPLHDDMRLCAGKTKTGKPCRNPAVKDSEFCRQHGGNVANAAGRFDRGNAGAWRHGAYSKRLRSASERALYREVLHAIERDFNLNDSTDRIEAEMVATYFVKWRAAAEANSDERQDHYDALIRKP